MKHGEPTPAWILHGTKRRHSQETERGLQTQHGAQPKPVSSSFVVGTQIDQPCTHVWDAVMEQNADMDRFVPVMATPQSFLLHASSHETMREQIYEDA